MLVEPLEKYLKDNRNIYETVRRYLPEGIIAGGAARQIFLGEKFGSTDVDFYFPTWGIWNDWASNFYGQGYKRYSRTRNAEGYLIFLEQIKLQLISITYSDTPQEIFDTFDFTCCMFAIKDDKLYFTEEAVEHATKKMLVVYKESNANDLYRRIGKYLRKGYFPSCPISNAALEDFLKYIDECKITKDNEFPFWPTWKDIPELENKMEEMFSSFFGPSTEDY